MTTITEDYISFETAKLLKEKGFNPLECGMYYSITTGKRTTELLTSLIACPTLQMTMKWLREVHNLQIIIIPIRTKQHKNWTFEMYKEFNLLTIDVSCFSTYEEACEAAIKYCLENLI